MTQFDTLYEFQPYMLDGSLWAGLFIIALIPVVLIGLRRDGNAPALNDWRIFWATLVGSELFAAFVLYPAVMRHLETWRHVEQGNVAIVTGEVSDILLVCDRLEGFVVAEVRFVYDDCGVTPGYVQGRGGTLQKGVVARIEYFDSSWGIRVITKVEVELR
jgi:hypothetical protein